MSAEWKDRIADDDLSRPRLRGNGLAVEAILNALAEGISKEKLLLAHPSLTDADVTACLAYAAEAVRRQIVVQKIKEGIADIEAGRFVPDEQLLASLGISDQEADAALRACRKEILLRLIREAEADTSPMTPDEDLDAIFGPLDEDDE